MRGFEHHLSEMAVHACSWRQKCIGLSQANGSLQWEADWERARACVRAFTQPHKASSQLERLLNSSPHNGKVRKACVLTSLRKLCSCTVMMLSAAGERQTEKAKAQSLDDNEKAQEKVKLWRTALMWKCFYLPSPSPSPPPPPLSCARYICMQRCATTRQTFEKRLERAKSEQLTIIMRVWCIKVE